MFLQYPGHFSIWFFCHFKNSDKKTLSFLSKIPKLAFKFQYRKKSDDKNKQTNKKEKEMMKSNQWLNKFDLQMISIVFTISFITDGN